jgi:Uma2 family endonuclease
MGTVIRNINQLDLNKVYTYADYFSWKIKERVELIKGKIFPMSPAPSMVHQRISIKLASRWERFLRHKPCEVFTAPFDVRLPKSTSTDPKKIYDVVQPDICVICDPSKLDEQGCIGAPDIIIEILSPGNTKKELTYKYDLYLKHKVKEYWIIQPLTETLLIYTLEKDKYVTDKLHTTGEVIRSSVFHDFKLNLKDIFTHE